MKRTLLIITVLALLALAAGVIGDYTLALPQIIVGPTVTPIIPADCPPPPWLYTDLGPWYRGCAQYYPPPLPTPLLNMCGPLDAWKCSGYVVVPTPANEPDNRWWLTPPFMYTPWPWQTPFPTPTPTPTITLTPTP